MPPIKAAIWVARGRIFSDLSEDSRRKSCIPPTRSMGRTASAVTMMPMPPIHCRMERHSRTPGGMSSSPVRIVAPVVVRPDVDSKNASVTDRPRSLITKGMAPKAASRTQVSETSRKAVRTVRRLPCPQLASASPPPRNIESPPPVAKARQSFDPAIRSASIGSIIAAPSPDSSTPITSITGRTSITLSWFPPKNTRRA